MNRALLVLADGTVFEGSGFGSAGEAVGEVVFNTSMTGYQEIVSDSSYKGQIVTMTYSQIGNYGINSGDVESAGGPKVEGFIVKEYLDFPSKWRSEMSLGKYLSDNNITCIQGIDTRALTRHLRNYGAQMGIISTIDGDPKSLLEKVKAHPGISAFDYVSSVSAKDSYKWTEKCWEWCPGMQNSVQPDGLKVVVYDFGIKFNILRNLAAAGFDITVVPGRTPAEAVLEFNPDGVILSNGPGDPESVTYAVENVRKLIGKKPIFGICLGHQILGLAMGGRTYKLKFGHHGGNHPVKDLETGRVEITAQNHNYCVDIHSLHGKAKLTHRNLYDGTEEGMQHVEFPVISVQHHPEGGPGPNDSSHLFKRFGELVKGR